MNKISLLGVLCFVTSGAVPGAAAQGLHTGIPPATTWNLYDDFAFDHGAVVAAIDTDVEGKTLDLSWRYAPFESYPEIGIDVDQTIATSYWPTAIRVIDANTVVVTGKERAPSNSTVVEIWTFSDPSAGYVGDVNNPSNIVWNFQPGERTAVDEVYDAATPGRDMIMAVFSLEGAPSDQLLVQFYDSRDLYKLECDTGTLTLAASPTGQSSGVITEPNLLSDSHSSYWQGEHNTHGYLYVFTQGGFIIEPSSTLVFFDSDKDGTLDGSLVLNGASWAASYANPADYAWIR